ncbi:hypothetical protein CEXT_31101 [Caerostris extrusa]|uniref:Uncharacterized protein n=1 Tax=Caerostris extrusa TaxID=172846 RepID=A0AAV4XGJ1_CAEEX|nr:hypothetical protein CEXT_31101 [Caerostris extrusa]
MEIQSLDSGFSMTIIFGYSQPRFHSFGSAFVVKVYYPSVVALQDQTKIMDVGHGLVDTFGSLPSLLHWGQNFLARTLPALFLPKYSTTHEDGASDSSADG